MAIKREDRSKIKWRCIFFNDKIARKVLRFLLKRLNIGLQLSQSRWGIQAFLFAIFLFFISLFFTILFSAIPIGGNVMQWVFLGLAVISFLLLLNLTLYFLCHPSKDPTAKQMRRMDKGISDLQQDMGIIKNNLTNVSANLDELPKIAELLKEIKEALKK